VFFEWILLLEIQKNCKKLVFLWKNQSSRALLDVFALPNLENFYPENVKNKECVHTWANGTSYTTRTYYNRVT
jgi:hypothetical protein